MPSATWGVIDRSVGHSAFRVLPTVPQPSSADFIPQITFRISANYQHPVCMPFSVHFYVSFTHFTLSLYCAVSLITNMQLSIHLMLISANFTRSNHLPMAQRTLRDQWPMHSYAQLLSKLLPSPQNGEVWGVPLSRKIKMWWIVSLEHNNLVFKVHFSNKLFKTAQP